MEKKFIQHLAQVIQPITSPLLPSVRLAQACLESDFGRSELAQQAHNYFGIKASPPWQGASYEVQTTEIINGKSTLKRVAFRRYPSVDASCRDHATFITSTPWRQSFYQQVMKSNTYTTQAQALTGTYATDPNYGAKLIRIIERYQLQQYDPVSAVDDASRVAPVIIHDRRDEALGGQQHDREESAIRTIVWHYTAVARELGRSIKDHERYWQRDLGWDRGGYHYYIDANGRVYQNYNLTRVTWGVANHNQSTVHISVEANSADNYSREQLRARHALTLQLLRHLSLSASSVRGHWEVNPNTACPGYSKADMDAFRASLERDLACPDSGPVGQLELDGRQYKIYPEDYHNH